MVAAQVQVGRIVAVSPDAGGMENVVNAQQAFEVTVGVHIATAASLEAIFEDVAQFGIGVGGRQGVEVTTGHHGVGAGEGELADGVCLLGALHEIVVQGGDGTLNDFGFAAGVVGVGKATFPSTAVLADAGGLQVVVEQTDGVAPQDDVALHATVGALGVGDELRVGERVAAEHGNGEYSANRIFAGNHGIAPVRKDFADAVHGKILVVAALLETEDVDFLLFHVTGDFFAGIAGDFTTEVAYVVGGYLQVAVGVVTAVVSFGNFSGEAELEDGKDVAIVEN